MRDKPLSRQIIEIADILFEGTDKKVSEILREYAKKCGKSEKTIERWVSKAREYNKKRLAEQEKVRDEVLRDEARNAARNAILTRNERLEILSDIAMGKKRREGTDENAELLVPSDGERIRAIAELNKMQGDYMPDKISAVIETEETMSAEDAAKFLKEMMNDYGGKIEGVN